MSVLGIIGKGLGLVSKVLGDGTAGAGAVEIVQRALAEDPSVRQAVTELEIEERKLLLEEVKATQDLYKEELKSEDGWVRRVRPACLWLVLLLLAINFGVIPIFNQIALYIGWEQVTLIYPELPQPVMWLFGSMFGLYTGARTVDKGMKARKNRG